MTRTPKNFRLPAITCQQLKALSEAWGVSQAEVIIICLDRINSQHESGLDIMEPAPSKE